jgi:hypothetical protein
MKVSLIGNGSVGGGAATSGETPPVGSSFEIGTNTGAVPINGTFTGLDEGAHFTRGGYVFQISYHGGTGGNSVVLSRL